jgi:hypothetical protein
MQEVPPSPALPRTNKHRMRFYLAASLVTLGMAALICASAFLILTGYWYISIAPIAWSGLLIFNTSYLLRKPHARARIETLLFEFDQISDRFVRPKDYRHKEFNRHPSRDIIPKSFVYGLCIDAEGEIKMPEMTHTPEHTYKNDFGIPITNDYGVSICINDDIVHIRKKEHEYTNNKLWLVRFFEKHSGKGQKNAHLRIHKGDVRSDVVAGDFMIEGDEFDAFMKTLELAKNFGTIPRFQP